MYARIDDWENQYLINLPYSHLVAWDDKTAYEKNSKLRWIYDKYMLLHKLTDQKPVILPSKEISYPCFIKPRINLLGMGIGARMINRPEKMPEKTGGLIACRFHTGEHVSTDYVIKNSKIIDELSYIAHKTNSGSFLLFETVSRSFPEINETVERAGIDFGIVNVEHIGGNIIEMHLRHGLQFFDISCNMQPQLPEFYRNQTYRQIDFQKGYSRVYRRSCDAFVSLKKIPEDPPRGVSSIQLAWINGYPLSALAQDEFSFKYLVINGHDLEEIEQYGEYMHDILTFE